MNPTFRDKKKLRTLILKKRDALDADWIEQNSALIHKRLKSLPAFNQAATIHTYIAWKNEVRTKALISELLKAGKQVVIPVVEKNTNRLKHSVLKSLTDLQPGAYGILEPATAHFIPCDISGIDCVIVPGVAFDLTGHRLGYGGGYYDTFLHHVSALKIALGFEFQIIEKIPVRNGDEKVDILVTEKRVYDFTRSL